MNTDFAVRASRVARATVGGASGHPGQFYRGLAAPLWEPDLPALSHPEHTSRLGFHTSVVADVVHLADEFPEMGVLSPLSLGGTATVLGLEVDDAEAVFAQAIAVGATVRQPLQDMFWGDRHGQLDDPFEHRWNVSQHLRDVPLDEQIAAA